MDHLFDEFSKLLAESLPRRESLRRLGAVFAGAVLSPLGLETAWAKGPEPCKTFCKCRNAKQQNQCLAACKACNGNTSRIGGTCGTHTCCSIASCKGVCSNLKSDPNCGACGNNCRAYGESCCGNYCADLANDIFNCGRCETVCAAPDPYETVACVSGACVYDCVEGAANCGDGMCRDLTSDPDNCGACGNVCPASAPVCVDGTCGEEPNCVFPSIPCGGICVLPTSDPFNCGGCGVQCAYDEACIGGFCESGAG